MNCFIAPGGDAWVDVGESQLRRDWSNSSDNEIPMAFAIRSITVSVGLRTARSTAEM